MYKIGITFDEKHFKSDPKRAIEQLVQIGYSSFELAFDQSIMNLSAYKSVMDTIKESSTSASFHVPSFLESRWFKPHLFASEKKVRSEFEHHFQSISELHSNYLTQNALVIVHGSEFESGHDQSLARYNSMKFIDHMLNFISAKSLPLVISLENAFSSAHDTYPDDVTTCADLISDYRNAPIGICLDFAHHVAKATSMALEPIDSSSSALQIQENIFPMVNHVHIHGADFNGFRNSKVYKSHIPVSKSEATVKRIYADMIGKLKDTSYTGIISNESLGLPETEFFSAAKEDFNAILDMTLDVPNLK